MPRKSRAPGIPEKPTGPGKQPERPAPIRLKEPPASVVQLDLLDSVTNDREGNSAATAPAQSPCPIDSGDSISFPNTWSHFLNELQPGVPIDTLVRLRMDNPGKGLHSVLGPTGVNKAEPGDVLEIRYKTDSPLRVGRYFQ